MIGVFNAIVMLKTYWYWALSGPLSIKVLLLNTNKGLKMSIDTKALALGIILFIVVFIKMGVFG